MREKLTGASPSGGATRGPQSFFFRARAAGVLVVIAVIAVAVRMVVVHTIDAP